MKFIVRQRLLSNRKIRLVIPAAVIIVSIGFPVPAAMTELHVKRQTLITSLDSIELEKQRCKRKGEPLNELEDFSRALRDSITGINNRIASGETESFPETGVTERARYGRSGDIFRDFRPRNLFDWIVIVIGGIAIISGAILFVNLLRILPRKGRPKPASRSLPRPAAQSANRKLNDKSPSVGHTAPREPDDYSIEKLRRKIQESEESRQNATEDNRPNFMRDAMPETPRDPSPSSNDLKSRIIAAARDGLTIGEITRRFQVSADQVSLILKIAQRNRNPGE